MFVEATCASVCLSAVDTPKSLIFAVFALLDSGLDMYVDFNLEIFASQFVVVEAFCSLVELFTVESFELTLSGCVFNSSLNVYDFL